MFYGMNWDAITGLVELPERLVLQEWRNVVKKLPSDAEIMKRLLAKFNKDHALILP